ncbi:MAG: hypothetical protein NDJ89_07610 [Oligoflexia bacterium]|nr:hypothetical protein [Oligoflexia bacterium]
MKKKLSTFVLGLGLILPPLAFAEAAPTPRTLLAKSEVSLVSGDYEGDHVLKKFECALREDGNVFTRTELLRHEGKKTEPVGPVLESTLPLVFEFQVAQLQELVRQTKDAKLQKRERLFRAFQTVSYSATVLGAKKGEELTFALYEVADGAKTEKVLAAPAAPLLMHALDAYCR